jgi:hypothetical protein
MKNSDSSDPWIQGIGGPSDKKILDQIRSAVSCPSMWGWGTPYMRTNSESADQSLVAFTSNFTESRGLAGHLIKKYLIR